MLGPTVALIGLASALAWAVLHRAGAYPPEWAVTLLLTGVISLLYSRFTKRRDCAPGLTHWLLIAIWALPGYLAFRLIPLPVSLVELLSPARAELARTLSPVIPGIRAVPLSSDVPAAVLGLFTIMGCIATFLLVRELAWRWNAHCWIAVIPLLIIAALEAICGDYQLVFGKSPQALGTYMNYEHFSSFLEMTLPLAALFGVALITGDKKSRKAPRLAAYGAGLVWAVAGLLLMGIAGSLSRAGIIIALGTLWVVAVLSAGFHVSSRISRMTGLLVASGTIVLVIVGLPSEPMSGPRALAASQDSPDQIALGFPGLVIILAIAFGVAAQIFKGMWRLAEEDRRLLVIACGASLVAGLLHSGLLHGALEFNLHAPANAMTLAWIAGVGSINGLD